MAEVTLKGGDKLKQYLNNISYKVNSGAELRVGFLANASYPDGKPVAMIAAIQEFGAPRAGIPPRPFFRNMIAKHQDEWPKGFATQLRETNYDLKATFERAGAAIAGQLRQSIVDTSDPPLSPITLMIRKMKSEGKTITAASLGEAARRVAAGESTGGISSKPLVETGHLLNSVDYEVKLK
jgi:hypothetical protein